MKTRRPDEGATRSMGIMVDVPRLGHMEVYTKHTWDFCFVGDLKIFFPPSSSPFQQCPKPCYIFCFSNRDVLMISHCKDPHSGESVSWISMLIDFRFPRLIFYGFD